MGIRYSSARTEVDLKTKVKYYKQMLTDDGQVGTKVWIRKMLMTTTSSPFFAKPNVVRCTISERKN